MTKPKIDAQKNYINIINQKFGRLIVLERIKNDRYGNAIFLCQCSCGNKIVTRGSGLRRGHVASCGCYHKDVVRAATKTHGLTHAPEYHAWDNMKRRCLNPLHPSYKDYGGRGIIVCDRWINSFDNFFADMGIRPKGLTLERKNNNGNYEPNNCCWDTRHRQQLNRRVCQA